MGFGYESSGYEGVRFQGFWLNYFGKEGFRLFEVFGCDGVGYQGFVSSGFRISCLRAAGFQVSGSRVFGFSGCRVSFFELRIIGFQGFGFRVGGYPGDEEEVQVGLVRREQHHRLQGGYE